MEQAPNSHLPAARRRLPARLPGWLAAPGRGPHRDAVRAESGRLMQRLLRF